MDDEEYSKFEVDDNDVELDDELALLPIRNAVLFPGAVAPFDVGREKSVALVEELDGSNQPIIVIFAQKDPATDDPDQDDLYPVGVAARLPRHRSRWPDRRDFGGPQLPGRSSSRSNATLSILSLE